MGQVDGATDDRFGLGVVAQAGQQLAVDLQLIDGQMGQAGQRGVAGAVVVDRDRVPGARSRSSVALARAGSPISVAGGAEVGRRRLRWAQ